MATKEQYRRYTGKFYVYVHIDPISHNVVYIGKGVRGRAWDKKGRGKEHRNWFENLSEANLTPIIKVIHVFNDEDTALDREWVMISNFRAMGFKLFNKMPGGGRVPSGKDHPLWGGTHTAETIEKISKAKKGGTPWNKGLKTGPNPATSARNKIRMVGNTIKRGTKSSESTKAKISESLKGNQYRSVKILCINNDKIYDSVKQAWTELGLDERSVFRVLKGEWKHTKGYKFKYI